jgi:Zn-dependent protease with chaperone function
VIAHELGHIKCEHGLWITALNIISLSLDQFGGGLGKLLSPAVENVLKRWQRSAEYTCDRAALLVSQDWRIVASTFLKLSGGSSSYSKSLDVDAFLQQSQLYEKAIKTRTGSMISSTMEQGATHPIPIFRVKELKKWSDGPQYKGILSRGIIKK